MTGAGSVYGRLRLAHFLPRLRKKAFPANTAARMMPTEQKPIKICLFLSMLSCPKLSPGLISSGSSAGRGAVPFSNPFSDPWSVTFSVSSAASMSVSDPVFSKSASSVYVLGFSAGNASVPSGSASFPPVCSFCSSV